MKQHTHDTKNTLLKRREVSFTMEHASNPGMAVVAQHVADTFKANPDVVVVKELRGTFGSNKFFARAFIYDTVQAKEHTEPKPKVKKKEGSA